MTRTLVIWSCVAASVFLSVILFVSSVSTGESYGPFGALLILSGMACMYFLPTVIAFQRQHHNFGAIVVVNFFLGWSGIGWIIALAMSAGEVRRPLSVE